MKKMLVVASMALAVASPRAQTPEDFVQQAERGSVAMTRTLVDQAIRTKKWFKRKTWVTELRYDVIKTSSVLTPLVGVLQGVLVEATSESKSTEAEAQLAEVNVKKATQWRAEMRFHPDQKRNRWVFASGKTTLWAGDTLLLDEQLTASEVAAGQAMLPGKWAKAIEDAVK